MKLAVSIKNYAHEDLRYQVRGRVHDKLFFDVGGRLHSPVFARIENNVYRLCRKNITGL